MKGVFTMLSFDTLVVLVIVVAAGAYLYRQFSAAKKGARCSCSSGGDCCQKKIR
jgi:cytochrome c oxidase assembly factor CtaG